MIAKKANINPLGQMQQDIDIIAELKAAKDKLPDLNLLMEELSESNQRHKPEEIVICLIGATGAGKSTLFYALIGRDIPVDNLSMSKQVTIYMPRTVDNADFAVGSANIHYYSLSPRTPWQGLVLIDTPDVNSTESNRAVAEQWAQKSDVLLVVMHRQSIVESSSVKFVETFKSRRHLVCILGHADKLTEKGRTALREQIKIVLREKWGRSDAPVFVISAKEAKRNPAASGDFDALIEYLCRLENKSEIMRIRHDNAVGTAADFRKLVSEIDAKVHPELRALVADVKAIGDRPGLILKEYLEQELEQCRGQFKRT